MSLKLYVNIWNNKMRGKLEWKGQLLRLWYHFFSAPFAMPRPGVPTSSMFSLLVAHCFNLKHVPWHSFRTLPTSSKGRFQPQACIPVAFQSPAGRFQPQACCPCGFSKCSNLKHITRLLFKTFPVWSRAISNIKHIFRVAFQSPAGSFQPHACFPCWFSKFVKLQHVPWPTFQPFPTSSSCQFQPPLGHHRRETALRDKAPSPSSVSIRFSGVDSFLHILSLRQQRGTMRGFRLKPQQGAEPPYRSPSKGFPEFRAPYL